MRPPNARVRRGESPAASPRALCRFGSWRCRGRERVHETTNDVACGLDRMDRGDALACLPVLLRCIRRIERRTLELPQRPECVHRAHVVFGASMTKQPPRERPGGEPHLLDVRCPDHGDRDAGDALAEYDIVL